MTKAGYSHITLVSDRSGSMESIRTDAEGGINAFIDEQKKQPGECSFLMVEFDTAHNTVFGPGPIRNMKPYMLEPRGATAMFDAIGQGIVRTGQYLKDMTEDERPEHVVFVIVTDGEENSSVEYKQAAIKEMIDRQTDTYGWIFEYLAANQDAVKNAHDMGIGNSTGYTPNAMSTNAVYASTSSNVSALRGGGTYTGGARHVDSTGTLIDDND